MAIDVAKIEIKSVSDASGLEELITDVDSFTNYEGFD